MSASARHEVTVRGMHCGGCVKSVTRAVSQVPGVRAVEVSLENGTASVQCDNAVAPAAIVAAIEAAGFEASAG